MTLGSKRRLTVLFAIAVLLIATQGAVAMTVEIGTVQGSLFNGHDFDGFIVGGLASDWNGVTARWRVSPSSNLDVYVCLALILPTPGGLVRRELGCVDNYGRGGADFVQEFISRSDFPNFTWQANAQLGIEVGRFSGFGNYTGTLSAIF